MSQKDELMQMLEKLGLARRMNVSEPTTLPRGTCAGMGNTDELLATWRGTITFTRPDGTKDPQDSVIGFAVRPGGKPRDALCVMVWRDDNKRYADLGGCRWEVFAEDIKGTPRDLVRSVKERIELGCKEFVQRLGADKVNASVVVHELYTTDTQFKIDALKRVGFSDEGWAKPAPERFVFDRDLARALNG